MTTQTQTPNKLSRDFRLYVLARLRQTPGWEPWYLANGFRGRTNNIPVADLKRACVELGLDKHALYCAFVADNDATAAVIATAHIAGENGADNGADSGGPQAGAEENMDDSAGVNPYEGRLAQDVIAETLAPIGVHLTPFLQNELPKALNALASAAVAGPRVETRETVRTVRIADVSAINAPPVVHVVERRAARDVFDLKRRDGGKAWAHALDHTMLDVCDYFDAPPIDADYVWSPEMASVLSLAAASGQNLWFAGHAGTGKTEGVRQFAARLRRPFVRIPIDRTTEPADLLGQKVPSKDGGIEWRDGALTRAFRTPRCVVLIDEPTLLRSGTLAFVQTALDTRCLHLVTGETVMCADGVVFVACDNTLGVGDESGRYVDTSPVNAAFLDRFAWRVTVDYLTQDDETHMISRRARLDVNAVRPMVEYATLTREKARGGQLGMGLTPRRLISWARAVALGLPSSRAWEMSVINGGAPEDVETLRMLEAQTLRGMHATIDAIARGLPLPQSSPPPSPIGEALPDDADDVAPIA
jgi:MoxR-like ATPase